MIRKEKYKMYKVMDQYLTHGSTAIAGNTLVECAVKINPEAC